MQWQGKPIPKRRYLIEDLIMLHTVAMISGDGGLGKTMLLLQLLVACALGRDWLGIPTLPCRAFGIFCEDDRDELHRRVADVVRYYGAEMNDLENLILVCRVGLDSEVMTFGADFGAGKITEFGDRLFGMITEFGAQAIGVDSLHDTFIANENSRPQARQFVGGFRILPLRFSASSLSSLRTILYIWCYNIVRKGGRELNLENVG